MEKIKNNKIAIFITLVLLFLIGGLYQEKVNLEWELVYEKSVPDVELINYLSFDSNNTASGSVTGFVVFDDKEKQPKGMRQYIQLTASEDFSSGKQKFYLVDIIKMDPLAPKYFDPVVLTVSNIEGNVVTLTDGNNNSYLVNKSTKEVSMFDATRDVTRLITNDSKFRDFMRDFLR